MSSRKFKFISPGVFLNEIDNSQLPNEPREIGPLFIGRAKRGPAMRPVTVDSFAEYVQLYGEPVPGGNSDDVWRNGNETTPTYGAYASQAWLKNSSTLTYLRLLGSKHLDATSAGEAGWKLSGTVTSGMKMVSTASFVEGGSASTGSAYGLFVVPNKLSSSATGIAATGSLAAVWYFEEGAIGLVGTTMSGNAIASTEIGKGMGRLIGSDASGIFTVTITGSSTNSYPDKVVSFSLSETSNNYIRTVFDTNPTLVNTTTTSTSQRQRYWLGETFTNQFAQRETRNEISGAGHAPDALAATATITFAGSIAYNQEITIISTDGTSKTYVAKADSDFANNQFDADGGFDDKATALKNAIEHASGHGSKITVTRDTAVLTLTQASAGASSNTTITSDLANTTVVSFNGGQDANTGQYLGIILPLVSGSGASTITHGTRQLGFEDGTTRYNPATGWVFSQDVGGESAKASYLYGNMTNLFRFHGLDHGEWAQNNLKVSIANIKYSKDDFNKYGSFDVLVRRASDNDQAPIVIERFSNCNLDARSLDYVARRVGDRFVQFNSTTRRLETRGDYTNNSKYIRIEMDAETYDAELLPFGVYGPLKYKNVLVAPDGLTPHAGQANNGDSTFDNNTFALGASQFVSASIVTEPELNLAQLIITGNIAATNAASPWLKFDFPKHEVRISASQDGISNPTDAYWGVWTGKSASNNKFNRDYYDLNRNKSSGLSSQYAVTAPTEYQFIFSLDEVVQTGDNSNIYFWESGSRVQGTALSSKTSGNTYKTVIDADINKFTMPLAGGSDGFDITEKDPFRNTLLSGKTDTTNYAYNSIKEAVDIVRDPEFVQYNLVSIPGITNEQLTTHLIETCELRADALAVIDLKGDFAPTHEGTSKTYPDLSTTITNLKARGINSSYGCAFYPFVQIRDTLAGNMVYMPPSVPAVGAMSYTDRIRAPWFAPAGFNRGGLSSGVSGLPVLNVTQRLTSQNRDDLYEANINPIASFPNEGIVIFGQKTLQVTRSALDRINVRRLLLFIKKGISNISSNLLFEPNVRATWSRFIGQAEPFLADVKSRFGLDDYKLVLDETTTTPDLIDRNILYAKVFLKPTRAIEFIAVDFIITNTGASFED